MKLTARILIATALCFVGFVSSAHAITYGADLVAVQADGSWQVHVEGFQAGDAVTVTLVCTGASDVVLGTATAGDDGTIDEFFTLPAGTNTDVCSINAAGGSVDKTFALGTPLPATGSNSLSALPIILGLLGVGAVLVVVSRIRRRTAQA